VRELTQAHGGTVTADSPGKGQGSTFSVTLPIPAVIPANIAAYKEREKGEPSISKLRVLVVDDDPDARALVALTLESRGAIVQSASTAREALEVINNSELDVLVSDIGMPEEDGYMLLQNLRAFEHKYSRKRLPAIALTAYASPTDCSQALATGYDLHLSKPVEPIELLLALVKCSTPCERAA